LVEYGRDIWKSSGPNPFLKQGHLEPAAQDHVLAFEYLQGWRLHNHPGQPVLVLRHRHSEKGFPDVQREPLVFWFLAIATGPVTGHHWEEPGSVLFAPSLQVFIQTDEILPSLLFSRLNSASSPSLSSHRDAPGPLPSAWPFYWTLSSSFVSILYWAAQKWTP